MNKIPPAEMIGARSAGGLDRRGSPQGLLRRMMRGFIFLFSYHVVLSRKSIRPVQAGGFRLTVRPTVFHPRFFVSSERFADFIDHLDLRGKRVIDVGTGTGILALAAARAGAEYVVPADINPNASLNAAESARANGLGDRVTGASPKHLAG